MSFYRLLGIGLLLGVCPGCFVAVEEPKPKGGVDVKINRDKGGLDVDVDVDVKKPVTP